MQLSVRYLIEKPGRRGELPRYFWQPSTALCAQGYAPQRVPDNWAEIQDPLELKRRAIETAQAINDQLDARRATEAQTQASVPRPARPAPPQLRTIDALITLYKTTDHFGAMRFKKSGRPRAPSTKRGYEQCLARIGAWAGDAPVTVIGAKRVRALKEGMAGTPAFANAVIRVLRLLLEFARREEWIAINPAIRPELLSTDPSGLLWPRQAVDLFVAAADGEGRHSIGTAVLVDEWIGQRQGDVLRLSRNLLQRATDGMVTIRQGKGGVAVSLPLGMVPHLVQRVDEERARLDKRYKDAKVKPATLIVAETTGQPYKADWFRHEFARIRKVMADKMRVAAGFVWTGKAWWSDEVEKRLHNLPASEITKEMVQEARRAASFEVDYLIPGKESDDPDAFRLFVDDLQFMHLRHTAVTRLLEADCSEELISVISGHSLESIKTIMKRYLVRTKKLARLAFQKRLDAEGIVAALPAPATKEGA